MAVPDYLKKVKIEKPLTFKNETIQIPVWVGQACLGLTFTLIQSPSSSDFLIDPDFLILSLQSQHPQPKSTEAAKWLDEHLWWGGGMPVKASEVKILGPGEYRD